MKKHTMALILLSAFLSLASLFMVLHSSFYSEANKIVISVPYNNGNNPVQEKSLAYIEQCAKLFEENNNGITICIEKIPADQYSEWLSTSYINANVPDIFAVLPADFYILASMKALEELSCIDLKSNISSNITEPWNINGKQFAIPYETNPPCIIVNKSLLEGVYVTLTAHNFDWMDLFYTCKFLTYDLDKDGVNDHFGVTNINWRTLVYANGQELFNNNQSESYFDNHNVEFAIKYAIEMSRLNISNYSDSFERGRAVMKVADLAQARYYINNYPNLDLEIYSFPKGPDGDFLTEPYDTPLAINSKSKQKNIAYEFLKFVVLNENNQEMLFADSYSFPVLKQTQISETTMSELAPYIHEDILNNIISSRMINVDFPQYYTLMDIADKEIFQYIKYESDIEYELKILNDTIRMAIINMKSTR